MDMAPVSHPALRRGHGRALTPVLLALVLSACSGSGADDAAMEAVAWQDVTMDLFRPFSAGEYVLRSRAQLDAALAAAPFRVFPIGLLAQEPPVPAWDFQSSMVVGVSMGEGPWCTAPRIREVVSDGTDMLVRYEAPASGTLACMKLAPLIGFALVPKVPGRVEFRLMDVQPARAS